MLFVLELDEAPLVALNGAILSCGAHLVAHADRIDVGEDSFWFAAGSEPRRRAYDEARDGGDRFCARTKARLSAGEPVVACPGTPQQPCDELYRELAWRDDLACYGCGFDPKAPEFEPPADPPEPSLRRFLDVARRSMRGSDDA